MKTLLFLYNTHAGKGRVASRLAAIQDALTKEGWLVTVHPTQGRGDAAAVVCDLGGYYDRVVCCGGDGTLHEVVDGMLKLTRRPPIGYIPAGTTNDFSKNLAFPRGTEAIARVAAAGVPRPVDIGRFNGRSFVYVAAFGAFTDVSYNTPQSFKNMFGHLAYVLEGAAQLGNIKPYRLTIEHDGGVLEGDFIYGMVSNTVSVGGFQGPLNGKVVLDDGLFETVLIRQPQNGVQLQSILRSLMQGQVQDGDDTVLAFRTSRMKVTSAQPLPWTLDGEFGGDPAVAEIENLTHAVTIVHGK